MIIVRPIITCTLLVAAILVAPATAQAHVGLHATAELAAGFVHPLTGLDHLLAMLAVGLWSTQHRGRAAWLIPAGFLAALAAGFGTGIAGLVLPVTEHAILASLLVLGLGIAFTIRLPTAAGAGIAAAFALFHGHAHGAELPAETAAVAFGLGMLAASLLLHLTGVVAGLASGRFESGLFARCAGCLIAAGGAVLALA